jgi:DNA primase
MAFDPAFLDELRMRVGLAEVVGRRTRLVKKGREHSGLCPFHNEKTPSFTVNEDKGFFHCFGCGAHGDVIGFVMRTENLSFPEAVERLANEAGLQLPNLTREAREQGKVRQSLHAVLEAAAQWFSQELQGPRGRAGQDYLRRRGMSEETIARFRIGFAPDGRGALKAALVKLGYAESLLIDAGLLRRREEGGETYDLFRNRIIFPITDRRGRVIAFGGRVLDPAPEGAPKYLNSPETSLFHKGRTLYGLAQAAEGARKEGLLVVTEGYMDAIAALIAGVPAVAPLGTALTEDQMAELWRFVPEPVLCFDGDSAGMRAAARAADRCLPLIGPGKTLRFVSLPGGEDPDSLIAAQGAATFRALLGTARPLSQLLWELAVAAGEPIDTPERIALVEKTLLDQAARIADPSLRKHYQDHLRNRVWHELRTARPQTWGARPGGARLGSAGGFSGEGSRREGLGRFKSGGRFGRMTPGAIGHGPVSFRHPDPLGQGDDGRAVRRERLLLATVVNHPGMLPEIIEDLAHISLESRGLDSLRQAILELAARFGAMGDGSGLDVASLRNHLTEQGFLPLIERLCGLQTGMIESFARPDADVADALKGWRSVLERQYRVVNLKAEIRAAELAHAQNPNDSTWARLQELIRESQSGTEDETELERFG